MINLAALVHANTYICIACRTIATSIRSTRSFLNFKLLKKSKILTCEWNYNKMQDFKLMHTSFKRTFSVMQRLHDSALAWTSAKCILGRQQIVTRLFFSITVRWMWWRNLPMRGLTESQWQSFDLCSLNTLWGFSQHKTVRWNFNTFFL